MIYPMVYQMAGPIGTRTIYIMDSQNIREVLGPLFDNFGVQETRLAVGGSFPCPVVFTIDLQDLLKLMVYFLLL